MITPSYARMMAAYTRWQNQSLMTAADTLSDGDRAADQGAFFGSIDATFAHLLWGDSIWLSRFGAAPAPQATSIADGTAPLPWGAFCARRRDVDALIIQWAESLDPQDLEGDLSWFSGATGRQMSRPRRQLIVHFFNHGTHHRGQIHAMLTRLGTTPWDTDLPFMPETAPHL